MSRSIKFRAWDKDLERMEYWSSGFAELFGYFSNVYQVERLHRFEWMQFTGLTDKNGKEIYEGDILADAHKQLTLVEWDIHKLNMVRMHARNREIIGSIYENPELLGV